jgi:peptidoglycan/xylan/chitin deacetylase (PgdA/CDA1 family)
MVCKPVPRRSHLSTCVHHVILNFHGVGPIPRSLEDAERNCWLEEDFFAAVLDLVRTSENVKLTFDDGNASDFEIVLPHLRRRGLPATFFVCSDRLDQPTFLSRAHVRQLRAEGRDVGSHGAEHLSWRNLSSGRLAVELENSRRVLDEVCRAPIDSAACPFGAYDRTVIHGLRRAGYNRVYTSDGGIAVAGGWLQARNTVTRSMTLDQVSRLIRLKSGGVAQGLINFRKLIKRLR